MDKELLNAFNNLSVALQNLADNLENNSKKADKSESMVADSLSKLDISEQIKSIDEGIKKITKSNAEIIDQQKQIIQALSKKEPKKSPETEKVTVQKKLTDIVQKIFTKQNDDSKKIESTNDAVTKKKESDTESPSKEKKKTIADGLKVILLIAAGVLAIGLAFKIIGKVDFASVIALGIALPLIAIAFKQIADMKVNIKTLATNLGGLILFSVAIAAASFIFARMKPVTIGQVLTTVFIAGAFIAIAPKIANMKIDIKELALNLAGLTLFSVGIVAASFIFARIQPITTGQALTAVLIASSFAALSFSIGKLTKSIKSVDLKGLFLMPLVLFTTSLAIVASSYILSAVRPVTIGQALTTVLISVAFAALSFSIGKLTKGIKDVSLKGLAMMPLVLITASLAITASSYILSAVKPIGFFQLLTSIAIAATFVVLSYSLAKIVDKVKDIEYKDIAKLPLILIAASAAIVGSSYLLSGVKLITFGQFLTSVGIAILFIPMAFALSLIAKGVKSIDNQSAIRLPLVLVAMSLAITASSYLLSEAKVIDGGKLFNLVLQAIALAAIGIVIGVAFFALQKLGLATPAGLKTVLFGGIAILAIATTIMVASQILSYGNYDKTPSIGWTLGTAASILAYGVLMAAAGAIIVGTGGVLGAAALIAGSLAVLGIAGTILGVDKILSEGDYSKSPSLEYAASVSLLLGTFGTTMAASALLLPLIAVGALSVLGIAGTILGVNKILSEGDYSKSPSLEYAASVSLLLGTFGTTMATSALLLPLIAIGSSSVEMIAESIRDSSKILSEGVYTGGPTEDWAKGVSLAIGAFAPVISSFGVGSILDSLFGISTEDSSNAIKMVANAIVESAGVFAGAGDNWKMGPPVAWSESVGKAIGAFAPVFDKLNFGLFGRTKIELMKSAITATTQGIITSANMFAESNVVYKNYPTTEWAEGVSKAIGAFAPVFDKLNFGLFGSTKVDVIESAITGTSMAIITSAALFGITGLKYKNYPTAEWSEGVSKAIEAFSPAMKWAADNSGWFSSGADDLQEIILAVGTSITGVSLIMQLGKFNIDINPNYFQSLKDAYISTFEIMNKSKDIGILDAAKMLLIAKAINNISLEISEGKYDISGLSSFVPSLKEVYSKTFEILKGVDGASLLDIPKMILIAKAIKNVSLEISQGNYSVLSFSDYATSIKEMYKNTFEILDDVRIADVSDIRTIVQTAVVIKEVSLEISKGKYDTTIPLNYGKGLIEAFKDFSVIEKIVDKMSSFNTKFAVSVSKSIAQISSIIATGNYNTIIPLSYGNSLSNLFSGYKNIIEVIKSITPGFFSNLYSQAVDGIEGFLGIEKITPESVAMNIVSLSKIISNGSYVSIPADWMQSVYENMTQYLKLIDLMSGSSSEIEIFGITLSAGKGISRISSDYDRLAKSIQNVASAVSSLDVEKMNAMRAMTGSVVLLSLMDPDQFDSMMDALEDKTSVLGNIFSKLEAGKPIEASISTVKSAITATDNSKSEMAELIGVVRSMAVSLGQISSYSGNISNYVNLLKSSGSSPSLRK